jgi:hypothetical protein
MLGAGADLPWTTHEAEAMKTNGTVLGPKYEPYLVETESSGEQCVKLAATGDYVEFTAAVAANSLVVRFSQADSPDGAGTSARFALSVNGQVVRPLVLDSHYTHLYGNYPFTNRPADGRRRNFYDELRVKDLPLAAGDVVRLQKVSGDEPESIIDLVDTENVAPRAAPAQALSLRDFGAQGDGQADDTAALLAAVAAAQAQGRPVWAPPGDYKLTGDIVLPSNVTIQGAGMWHTTFVGDAALYPQAAHRVRFKLAGRDIHLADFAIVGKLNYRNDDEPNDGIVGAGCADSSVSRIWIEHTKVGVWIYNGTNLRFEGLRLRNLLADGMNLCVGTSGTVVENSSARGTGDDCFAIWPTVSDQGFTNLSPQPGNNVFRRCTGSLPFLANGAAIYGGASNRVEDCLFTDITTGCGVLISTTFPTSDEKRGIDNNFSGTTVVQDTELIRCGGYDHVWGWRGAMQVCLDKRSISGLVVRRLSIRDSLSSSLTVVAPGAAKGDGALSRARLEQVVIGKGGLATPDATGLFIREDAVGSLEIIDSQIAGTRNSSAHFQVLGKAD